MRSRLVTVLAFALAIGLSAASAPAQESSDDPARLRLETERVVVFKDGYCLVVRRGIATSNADGEIYTEEVPDAAVLGSFWVTPAEGRLRSMTAGVEDVTETTSETVACLEYLELLAANEGKVAIVQLDDSTEVRGTIRDVLTTTREVPTQPAGAYRGPWTAAAPPSSTIASLQGSLFVLSGDAGEIALPVNRVRGLTIRDMQVTRERTTTTASRRKRLTFRFEGGASERTVHVMYFRPGVRWIPTYRLGLGGDDDAAEKRATLRLQAEILNEAEDLEDVALDLVVGVPSFRFKEVVSPFVLEQTLQNALAQAAPQLMGQQVIGGGSNAFFSNRAGEWRGATAPPPGATGAAGIPSDIAADRSQDLFVYSLPPVTIRRGERMAVPVFESEVAYRDVYTWDLHLTRSDVEGAPAGRDTSPLALSQNRIWHQVELTNSTDVPWTTGACMLLEGGQPLGQDLLTYTAAGARVRMPVTVAIDLRGDVAEEETGREMSALRWNHSDYARIDKVARLTVTSFKRETVDVEILCRFGGRALTATPEGKIRIGTFQREDWTQYNGHPAVNNHSEVLFTLRLPPGEAVTPEITFHYFARN